MVSRCCACRVYFVELGDGDKEYVWIVDKMERLE